MLTIQQFNDWLYDHGSEPHILLCEGITPTILRQTNPEFAKVFNHVVGWEGFVYIVVEGHSKWVARKHITPKR